MKNFKNIFYCSLSLLIAGTACDSEDDLVNERIAENAVTPTEYSAGSADFSNYISIGNSLTAGFSDAALYPEGQAFSYPNIIAGQLALSGGGSFVFPDITSGNGFGGVDGTTIEGKSFIDIATALAAIAGDPDVAVADAIQTTTGTLLNTSSNTGANLNNFGVPGARLVDLGVAGYGAVNPFFGAFQTSAAASIIGDAVSADASFFSLWIGNNDVLGYAINGGAAGEVFDPVNPQTITDAGSFSAALTANLNALSAGGANGVILNIPPITLIPFFQTVTTLGGGINLIPIPNQPTADAVNAGYAAYNANLDGLVGVPPANLTQEEADYRKVQFSVGANPPVILDESLADLTVFNAALVNMRQAKVAPTGATDLFPLTALAVIGSLADPSNPASVYGVGVPIPDNFSLTLDEQTNVITAYATYNAIIAGQVAARPNITLVDVGPLFADAFGLVPAQAAGLQLSAEAQAAADGVLGINVGGFDLVPLSLSQEALFNSIWSSDGVHPNPRGAALIANEIIDVINSNYNATIPTVNPLDFPGINAQ